MKTIKFPLIFLLGLSLLSGLFSQEAAIEISSSANYQGAQPPESVLDGETGTSYRLQPGATQAWLRMDFSEALYLEALELEGFIPEGAQLSLQTEKEDRIVTLPMGFIQGPVEGRLLDLSRDKQRVDNLTLRIEGPNLMDFRIDEIHLTTGSIDEELHKKQLIPEELYYNQNQLNNDFLLVDGKIGTVWHNLNQGVDHIIYWLHRQDGTRVTPNSDDWAIRQDILFTVAHPGPMEFFKYYLADNARGEMTLYALVEDQWVDLGTSHLETLSGWQKVDLQGLGEITRIRMALEDPSQPWNRGEYGGIGEVELWARAGGEESFLQDLNAEEGLFTLAQWMEQDYLLQLVCTKQEDKAPDAAVNGYDLESSDSVDFGEYRLWEFPLEYYFLNPDQNDIKVDLQNGQSLISSHIICRGTGPLSLSGEEIFHDGLRHSSMNMSNDPLFLELLEGEADIEEILLYFKDRKPTYLQGGTEYQQMPLTPQNDEENPLRYTEPGLLKDLTLEVSGDLQEVEVTGSPNEIIKPYVEILFPLPGMHLPQYTSYSYKVVGITDCPDAHIEINGHTAQISDGFFWVEMRDLDLSSSGYHHLHAKAVRSNGEESEHSIDIFMESDSNTLILDQEDKLYVTWEERMVFSGKTNGNASVLKVNGEVVSPSQGNRFSYRAQLEQGLNRLVFSLESPDGSEIFQEESRRVLRQSTNPSLHISQPVEGEFIQGNSVDVSGQVSPWGLEELRINDMRVSVQGDRFSERIPLSAGERLIRVEALYVSGVRIDKSVSIQKDSEGPQILNVSPEEGFMTADDDLWVQGMVRDNQDVSVFINGRIAAVNGDSFSLMLPLPHEGVNSIDITARDLAGNTSSWPEFTVFKDSTPPEAFEIEVDPSVYTQNQRPIIRFETTDAASGLDRYYVSVNGLEFFEQASPYQLPYLTEGPNQIVVRAVDMLGNYRDERVEITIDTHAEAAPGDFRAVPGNERVLLRWSDEREGISHYLTGCMETEEESRVEFLAGKKNYEIPFEGLQPNEDYRFYIQTVDLAGNVGEKRFYSVQTSITETDHNPQTETFLEYDGLEIHMLPESLTEEVDRVVMEEIESPGHVAQSRNPVLSPVYDFKVEVDGELWNHAYFDKPFEGRIHYDESLIPEYFPEEKLAVFYYDEDWCTWLMADTCIVDTEDNSISFLSDHFTEYNVQATVTDQVDYRDWDGLEFPLASESTTHSPLEVSPQNGALSTSMTEFVLPGKNGLDLEVRRTYSTTLADSDSTLMPINSKPQLSMNDPKEALEDFLRDSQGKISNWEDSRIREMLNKRAELAYALGLGWRLDFPYIRFADKDVMVYIPGQGILFSGDLKKEFVGDNEKREVSRYTDSLNGRGTLEIHREVSAEYNMGGYNVTYDLEEIVFTEKNGRKYTFYPDGLISSISDPYDNIIEFSYVDFKLSEITDSYGRTVKFSYNSSDLNLPVCEQIIIEGLDDQNTDNTEIVEGQITYEYLSEDEDLISSYCEKHDISMPENNSVVFGGLPLLKSSTDIGGRKWDYGYALTYLNSTYQYIRESGNGNDDFGMNRSSFGDNSSRYYPDKTKSVYVFPLRSISGLGVGYETVGYQASAAAGSGYFYDQSNNYKYMNSEEELKNRTESLSVNYINTYDDEDIPGLKKVTNFSYVTNDRGIITETTINKEIITETTINNGRKSETYSYKELEFTIDYPEPEYRCAGNPDKDIKSWQMTSYKLHLLDSEGTPLPSPVETRKYSYNGLMEHPIRIQRSLGSEQEIVDTYDYDEWGNVLAHKHSEKSPELTQTSFSYFSYTERSPVNASGFFSPDGWDQTNINSLHKLGIYDRLLCSFQRYERNGEPTETLPQMGVYTYNDKGNLSYQAERTQDEWATQSYEYDENGRLSSHTNPMDLVTHYTYNEETDFRRVEHSYSLKHISSPTTLTPQSTLSDLNLESNITRTLYENSIYGFLIKESQGGVETTYQQDLLGRVEKITQPIGDNTSSPETQIDYVNEERTVTLTDPLGNISIFSFNLRGEIEQIQKKTIIEELNEQGESVQREISIQQVDIKQDYFGNIASVTTYPDINDTNKNNVLTYTYDGLGRILSESYKEESSVGAIQEERTVQYEYDDDNRIVTIINEANQRTRQYLDPSGRVLKTEECNSHGAVLRTRSYSYNARGEKISETDGRGNITHYSYDPQGNLIEVSSTEEDYYYQGLNENGELKQKNHYNVMGLIDTEAVYLGTTLISSKSYSYNKLGQLTEESINYSNSHFPVPSDKNPATTHYFYDQFGNQVCRQDPSGNLWISQYTTRGMVKREISPNGGITSYTYDVKDRLQTMTDPLQNYKVEEAQKYTNYDGTISYNYDSLDRLITATLPKRSNAASAPVISFAYDSVGNLLSRTDPDLSVTSYTYSLQNRVLSEIHSVRNDVISSIYYEYDELGRLTDEIPQKEDESDAYKTSYTYDDLGRMDSRTAADEGISYFGYDLNDNLIWQEDGRGFRQFFNFDALNRMTRMVDAEGGTWEYKYHPLGSVSYTKDPNNVIQKTYYDERGSVIKESDGRNLNSYFSYDANGNLAKMQDKNGTLIEYTYNVLNLPINVSYTSQDEAETQNLTYLYDLAGNLVQAADGNIVISYNNATLNGNDVTNYTPDPYGQIIRQETRGYGEAHQGSRQVSYSYNHLNQLASISHDGSTVNYSYNPLNQINNINLNGTQDLIQSVVYNDRGFLSSYTMGNGILSTRSYDNKGRLDILSYTKDQNTLKQYDFGYDLSDNIISKNENLYAYDGKNQLSTAMLTGDSVPGEEEEVTYAGSYSVQKDVLGAMELELMPEGEENFKLEWGARSIGVDTVHPYRISKVVLNLQDVGTNYAITKDNLQIFTSSGNRNGNFSQSFIQSIEQEETKIIITLEEPVMARYIKVHSLIDDRDKDNNPLPSSLKTAALNQTNPITLYRMVGGGRNEMYSYDAKGLRTVRTIYTGESITSNYGYINGSDLLESDGVWYYKYDSNGNLIGKMAIGEDTVYSDMTIDTLDWKYTYDLRNRLIMVEQRIEDTLEEVAKYVYDYNGYRIEKIDSDDVRTQYVFDQFGNMIQEERGSVKTDYFFMGNTHIAMKKGETLNYFATDHLGSTSLITNEEGGTINNVEANPFGDQEDKSLFYTGKQWDEDAQLYYFNARWYDPETGRFITEDPIRDGLLWYSYCSNNPMGFVDHTGLEQIDYSRMGDADYRQQISESERSRGNSPNLGLELYIPIFPLDNKRDITIGTLSQYEPPKPENAVRNLLHSIDDSISRGAGWLFGLGPEDQVLTMRGDLIDMTPYGVWTNDQKYRQGGFITAMLMLDVFALTSETALAASFLDDFAKSSPIQESPFQIHLNPNTRTGPMAIDTSLFTSGKKTLNGGLRNRTQFWSSWADEFAETLSKKNMAMIDGGKSPVVDNVWLNTFPEFENYLGEKIIHHHLNYGKMAVPLPQSVHSLQPGWGIWHP